MSVLFRLLGLLALGRAIRKGPSAVGLLFLRRRLHRQVRRIG